MRATVALAAMLVAACGSTPVLPTPTARPSAASPTPAVAPTATSGPSGQPTEPPEKQVGDLALEECDALGYVPCQHQAAMLRVPIAGTGVALVYSSEFAAGRTDRPQAWDPTPLGLGGWSLDVVQRYDSENGVLLGGDGSWRLAQPVSLPTGQTAAPSFDGTLAYVFDPAGRHVRTVQAILGVEVMSFTYDDAGRLLTAKGSLNNKPIDLTVERTAEGMATGLIGRDGLSTPLIVDGAQHLAGISHPDGGGDAMIVDANGLMTLQVDPAGGVTRFDYDAFGRLSTFTDPDGVSSRYARTDSNSEIEVTLAHALGDASTFRNRLLDSGIERTYIAPGGPATVVTAAPDVEWTVALPNGTRLTIGAAADPFWGMSAPVQTPVEEVRSDGVVREYTVDESAQREPGNPLAPTSWMRTTTINGDAYVEQLDTARRAMVSVDPLGRETISGYDGQGRLAAYSEPGQRAAAFAYDEQGRLASDTRGTGADAALTSYSYGANGAVTVTRPDGATESLIYDAAGRLVEQVAGDGSSLLSSFDAAGRAILVRPSGSQSTTLGYSPAGRPTAYVPPAVAGDGSYELRTYDDAGRLAGVAGPGAREIALGYDDAGRQTSLAFDRGQLEIGYDPATNRPATISAPGGVVTSYAYTGDLVSAVAWTGPVAGNVRLEFDALGRPVGEVVNSGAPVRSDYDGAGGLTLVGDVELEHDGDTGLTVAARLGQTRLTWQHDANGLVIGALATAGGNELIAWSYERDIFGRITRLTESTPAGQRTIEYGYDGAGRLATITSDGATEQSTYDARGNRLSVSATGLSVEAEYDARNQLRRWADVTFAYEPDGTLAGRLDGGASTTYDFDDLGALRAVALPDGRRIEYVVDGAGRPVGRRVNGALTAAYLYRPDGLLVAELDPTGQLVARFGRGGDGHLISMERDGKTFLIVSDALGSPRLVVDSATGAVAQAIDYDAWGKVVSDSNPGFQPFGFAGGLLDRDSGLMHFGAREYDPSIGRWIEPDPMRFESGGANLYEYAAGDPVNRSDPSGLEPPLAHDCTVDNPCTKETWHPEEDGSWTVCRAAGGASECFPWYGPDPKPGEPPPSGGHWPPGGPPPPQDPDAPPTPAPPDPGKKGGGGYCVGICFKPGGGICIGFCSMGDPHIRTADGAGVGFQGAGEYLMVTSADGGPVIQARQQPPAPDANLITITTAVAASVAGDRVGVYLGDPARLMVNGAEVRGDETTLVLDNGGSVTRHGASFIIEWPDGSRLTVMQSGNHLNYGFDPDPGIAPTLAGVMGTPNGDVGDDLVSRDGGVRLDIGQPDFFEQLHGTFGDSWRLSQAESLFDYAPGESTATFTLADFPRAPATPDAVDPSARAAAEALCLAVGVTSEPTLSDCIVDVGLTGDPAYAASAALVQASTDAAPPRAAPVPIAIGATIAGVTTSPDDQRRYTFPAVAGQAVYLDAQIGCVNQLSWRLIDPSDNSIGQQFVCNDLGRLELTLTGNYTIHVFSPTGAFDFGPFAFSVLPASTSTPTAVAFGEPVTGQVAQIGDQPAFAFQVEANQAVYLDATGPCVDGLRWRLVAPSGSWIANWPSCEDIGREVLLEAGTYSVVVYSVEAATGSFGFVVSIGP